MKVNSSKSKVMALNCKNVECSLSIRDESLPEAGEFKCLEILLTRWKVGTRDGQMDRGFIISNEGTALVPHKTYNSFPLCI